MKPKVEPLHLLQEESFRLLRWNARDVTDVEAIGADGRTYRFKGAGDVWHCHPGMEIVLITQGSGTRFVGDNISAFKAIDLVLLGPNLPHHWHARHPLSGYALQFDFGHEHALWRFPEARELGTLWRNAQKGIRFAGRVADDVAGLIQALPGHGGVGRLAHFLMILERLRQAPRENGILLSQKSLPGSQSPSSYRGIQKAIHVVLSSYQEDLSLADLMQAACMSKATFERQFKRHTGKTFTRFLTEVRIDAVRRQLVETELSIGEIAFASGFNNLSHFNHQFALIHGESPGAFRRKMSTAKPKRGSNARPARSANR